MSERGRSTVVEWHHTEYVSWSDSCTQRRKTQDLCATIEFVQGFEDNCGVGWSPGETGGERYGVDHPSYVLSTHFQASPSIM